MEQLPKDSMMLLSVINMKLRDFYPSLEALCEDMELDTGELQQRFSQLGYVYNAEYNRFI